MGIGIQVGLWDTIATALEDDCNGVYVDRSVSKEGPRDSARPLRWWIESRGMGGNEEDGEEACSASDARPNPHCCGKSIVVEETAEQKWTS